ncbi:hypothetical protein C8T65DRAFT_737454 [Cerioporus squamosus]|nr:hypothetical protein C8T65DRAFT_737454 [Cerioporus squamosus]
MAEPNLTVNSFVASSELFKSTCGTLFARMIDTVPKDVQLTEVIESLPVKPQSVLLTYMGDGIIRLTGQVRIMWANRAGHTDPSHADVLSTNDDMLASALHDGNFTSVWYNIGPTGENFATRVDAAGLSKFWFEIDEGDRSGIRTEDQNGVGFVLQDVVMLADSSCESFDTSSITIDVAVRRDVTPSRVYLKSDVFNTANDGSPVTGSKRTSSEYDIWTVQLPDSALGTNIAVDVGDQKFTSASFVPFTLISGKECQ